MLGRKNCCEWLMRKKTFLSLDLIICTSIIGPTQEQRQPCRVDGIIRNSYALIDGNMEIMLNGGLWQDKC